MSSIVGGVVSITDDDQSYVTDDGDITVQLQKWKRTGVQSTTHGTAGYMEEPLELFVEFSAVLVDEMDLDALFDVTDATVTVTTKSGRQGILYHAWYAGEGNVETREGKVPVRFQGKAGKWIS